jgi:hypothetical protein
MDTVGVTNGTDLNKAVLEYVESPVQSQEPLKAEDLLLQGTREPRQKQEKFEA